MKTTKQHPLNYVQFCIKNNYLTDYDALSTSIAMSSPGNSKNKSNSSINREKAQLIAILKNVEEGKIMYKEYLQNFKKLSRIEELKLIAKGHPDLKSTQAAIRCLNKINVNEGSEDE